jgi:hypothetical protein
MLNDRDCNVYFFTTPKLPLNRCPEPLNDFPQMLEILALALAVIVIAKFVIH